MLKRFATLELPDAMLVRSRLGKLIMSIQDHLR